MLLLQILYLLSALLLAIYGLNAAIHTWLYIVVSRRSNDQETNAPIDTDTLPPMVTVQLPIRNERYVVWRLLDAVIQLDWPADRLEIQLLDDSDDDTPQIVEAFIADLGDAGKHISHIRRADRSGYKAGALQLGMASSSGEYIAIFDADFLPTTDFLLRILPCFADPQIGCVQARWGHVNADASQLTQAQSLGIDRHFLVEQTVRDRIGAFLNFNGTAGVWRRSCMDDVGGWEGDTLTEDLDLSYRAQLAGWRIAFRPDLVVPAELPMQVDAYKRQQFRWAKGSLQTAQKLLPSLWRAPEPLWRKAQGTLHLTNYMVHPLMVLNLLLLLPIMSTNSFLPRIAAFLTTAAIGPPLMYWIAMRYRPWSRARKLRQLAILVAIGTGVSLNNTRAALEAFFGVESEFKRTPKFATTDRSTEWQSSSYALPRNPIVWLEVGFAFYSIGLLCYSIISGQWWVILWIALYAFGYGYVALLAIAQGWQVHRRIRRGPQPVRPSVAVQRVQPLMAPIDDPVSD